MVTKLPWKVDTGKIPTTQNTQTTQVAQPFAGAVATGKTPVAKPLSTPFGEAPSFTPVSAKTTVVNPIETPFKKPTTEWQPLEPKTETEKLFASVFPGKGISDVIGYATSQPADFLSDLQDKGWTESTDAIIKFMLPDVTNEELQGLFGASAPYVPENWLKDHIIDPMTAMLHKIRQADEMVTYTILPNAIRQAFELGEWEISQLPASSEERQAVSELQRQNAENANAELMRRLNNLIAEEQEWQNANPQLAPKPDYLKDPWVNTELFKDPGYYAYTISSSLPYTVATMSMMALGGTIGGPPGAMTAGTITAGLPEAADMLVELVNNGVPYDEAVRWAILQGGVAGGIEMGSDYFLMGLMAKPFKPLTNSIANVLTKSLIGRIVAAGTTGLIATQTEGIEELLTQVSHNSILRVYDESQAILEGVAQAYINGVIGSMPFAGVGGFAQFKTFYSGLSGSTKEKYDSVVDKLVSIGLSLEEARVEATKITALRLEDREQIEAALQDAQTEFFYSQGVTTINEQTIADWWTNTGQYMETYSQTDWMTPQVTLTPSPREEGVYSIVVDEQSVGAVATFPQEDSLFVNRISIMEEGTLTRSILVQLDNLLGNMAREQGKQYLRIAVREENLRLYRIAGYTQEEGTNIVRKDVSEYQYAPTFAMAEENVSSDITRRINDLQSKIEREESSVNPDNAQIKEWQNEITSLQKTAKEPWQMTREEISEQAIAKKSKEIPGDVSDRQWRINVYESDTLVHHKSQVQQALSEGKPVPAEVLKDYPDLVGGEVAGEVVTETVVPETESPEGDVASIPPDIPNTPPPNTPEGDALGRSDNEFSGFMKDLQDAQTVADIYSRNDLVRKMANNLPGLKGLFRRLNPSVVANTPAEKAIIVRATLRDEGQQKAPGAMAYQQEIGTQEQMFGKTDEKHRIKEGPLRGHTVGDIAQSRAKFESRLTDEQKMWLDRSLVIEDACVELLEENDIEVKKLSLPEGGQFATRQVYVKKVNGEVIDVAYVGAGTRRPGSKISTEKHRFFETEADAIAEGYEYIPYEEALYLKVLGTYNRIADKKMADWLLTKVDWRTTGAPETLILAAESARLKLRYAQMLLAALNRAVRGERVPTATINAIGRYFPEQAVELDYIVRYRRHARRGGGVARAVSNLRNVAKGLVATNKMEYANAVSARARAREAALQVKMGEAVIPAPAFQGKILTGPDAKETADTLRKSFDTSFSRVLGEVNKANAVARYFMLAGDFSPFTIQLIFMMGANPKIYGRAFVGAIRAMVSTEFQEKFLFQHKNTIDNHPNLLISKGGATEFTEAMSRGGWLSGKTSFRPEGENYAKSVAMFLPRATGKVGGTALSPFQRVFESALDCAGIYMAEAYEHLCTTPENTAEVDQFINEFRGLTSTSRIGISGQQRQAETAILLAARYNRAIAGLLWDLTRGNIRGSLARKSLIKGIAALTAMAVVISLARGEDKDEILDHLNPNSSNFFTWDIAGQKVGPGSKVRSLIKLLAQSVNNPDDLLKFSMDNPALRFVRGNLAPAVSSALDLITGKDYIGDPTRDGMLSFSEKILAGNLLPIWVQAVLFEGGSIGGRTARGLSEFFGGRAYPVPLYEEVGELRDKYANQDYKRDWGDLNNAQIDRVRKNHPDLAELEEKAELESVARGSEFEQWFYNTQKQITEERNTSLDDAAELFLNGTISKYDYDKERSYARPYYSGGMAVLYSARDSLNPEAVKDINSWLADNQKPEDRALDEYWKKYSELISQSDLPIDWDNIESKMTTYLNTLSPSIKTYVTSNLNNWINDLPPNAQKVEQMRLQGIENETWWDNYRGSSTTTSTPWEQAGTTTSSLPWKV